MTLPVDAVKEKQGDLNTITAAAEVLSGRSPKGKLARLLPCDLEEAHAYLAEVARQAFSAHLSV